MFDGPIARRRRHCQRPPIPGPCPLDAPVQKVAHESEDGGSHGLVARRALHPRHGVRFAKTPRAPRCVHKADDVRLLVSYSCIQ